MNNKKNQINKKIRIISGKFKGRTIQVVQNKHLRPTTSIARERLFNWLYSYIPQAKCLDCFAGSGALGIEALSRNAAYVTFVEKNNSISKQLKKNLKTLKIKNAEIINTTCQKWLEKNNDYKIIFFDPPFQQNVLKLYKKIFIEHNFSTNTMIYIETATKHNNIQIPKHWKLYKEKISKNVSYKLFLKK